MAYAPSGTSVVSLSMSYVPQKSHLFLQTSSPLDDYGNSLSATWIPSPMQMSHFPEDMTSSMALSDQSTFLTNAWGSNVRDTGIEDHTLSMLSASTGPILSTQAVKPSYYSGGSGFSDPTTFSTATIPVGLQQVDALQNMRNDQAQPSRGLIPEQRIRNPKNLAKEEYRDSLATPASCSSYSSAGPNISTGSDYRGTSPEILGPHQRSLAVPDGTLPPLLTDQWNLDQGIHLCTVAACPKGKGNGFPSVYHLQAHEKRHHCSYSGCRKIITDVQNKRAHMHMHRAQSTCKPRNRVNR